MDSSQVEWLRKRYTETPSEGPQAKRVKFEDVYNDITSAFPNTKFNHKMVSDVVKSVFPCSTSRQVGKARNSHIFGIEPKEQPGPHSDSTSQQLEQEIKLNSQLRQQVKALEERVCGLEQHLCGQINSLTTSNHIAYHGPDTVDHFNGFTMAKLVEEFEQSAPDVLQLLRALGHTGTRDDDEEVDPTADTKVVMAMCALLKSRTRKVLGLQLLISFMLVARSTSSQVM